MAKVPDSIAEFLAGKRIAVAGVSRESATAANAIYRKLREGGREVIPLNPGATELEGATCYPDVRAVPGQIDGLLFAAPPRVALEVVRQCAERGIKRIWFHRSFGEGSVSADAVRECEELGIRAIVGGCPMMYCEPVDPFHGCMRWWLTRTGKIGA
jgi:uncharacterized protein